MSETERSNKSLLKLALTCGTLRERIQSVYTEGFDGDFSDPDFEKVLIKLEESLTDLDNWLNRAPPEEETIQIEGKPFSMNLCSEFGGQPDVTETN